MREFLSSTPSPQGQGQDGRTDGQRRGARGRAHAETADCAEQQPYQRPARPVVRRRKIHDTGNNEEKKEWGLNC